MYTCSASDPEFKASLGLQSEILHRRQGEGRVGLEKQGKRPLSELDAAFCICTPSIPMVGWQVETELPSSRAAQQK